MTIATDHFQISRHFMDEARREFDAGDLLQASEKAWGAAAHAVKGVAGQRGMRHSGHRALIQAVSQLSEETGQPELRRMFQIAETLHANFYENWMPESMVRDSIADVRRLIPLLEDLADDESQI